MAEPKLIELDDAVSRIKQACEGRAQGSLSPFFFMVGAGISQPSVPLARDIISHCKETACSYGRINEPDKKNTLDEYSHWFQTAYAEPDRRQRYLRELIELKPITHANFRLAHLLLNNTVSNLVVTTNFDDFLSKALTLFGKSHIVCDHPSTVGRINHTREMLQIVHLHGSYWFYDCCNLRGELEDRAQQSRQTTSTMASLLDQILWERSPLVIGYSGWDGDVFMEALRRRLARPLGTNVYWFCYRRNQVDTLPDDLKSSPNIFFVVPPKPPESLNSDSTGQEAIETRQESLRGIEKDSSANKTDELALSAQTVLDKLIQAFQLEAPELTKDPLGFFAQSLEDSLPKDEASDGGSDIYAIRNVIERVKQAKQREDQANTVRGVSPTESKLGAVRDALRRAEYREAIKKVEQMELDALSIKELDELADAMFSAAVGLLDNSEDELAGYELVIRIRDLHSRKAAQSQLMKEQVAKALINKGMTLANLNRREEAIAAFGSVVQQFESATEPALRHRVTKALFNKAVVLGELDRNEEAVTTYDQVVLQFGNDPEVPQKEQVAKSLVNRGVQLRALNRTEKAIESYEEVVQRYGTAPELALRQQVAMALNNKGNRLKFLKRNDEALTAYDETIHRFGQAEESELRLRVARALSFKAELLNELSRSEEAMATYKELIRRYGEAAEPQIQQIVEEARTSIAAEN